MYEGGYSQRLGAMYEGVYSHRLCAVYEGVYSLHRQAHFPPPGAKLRGQTSLVRLRTGHVVQSKGEVLCYHRQNTFCILYSGLNYYYCYWDVGLWGV